MAEEGFDPGGPLTAFLEDWRALRPDLEPAAFSIVMYIRHLNLTAGRIIDDIAAEFDVNDSDVRLMMAIKRDQGGKPVRPSELSDRLSLTRGTITYRVDRLLAVGLAERIADPSDRRALFVRLTRKGEDVLNKVMTGFAAASEQALVRVDRMAGGRGALDTRLQALVADLEKAAPPRA